MFLLINNYQSEETMPYIVSAEKFASYDAAMQAAKNAAEDAMVNEYTEIWHWKGTKARRKAFRNRVRENRMAGEPKRTVRCV